MAALLWLSLVLPAAGALLVRVAPRRAAGPLAAAAALLAAVPPWLLLGAEAGATGFAWIPGGGLEVGLRLDALSSVMAVTVATVGLVVLAYAAGYFAREPRRRSALAGLLAFLAAMQGLVLADGYLALLIFWELVGAASARLIAFSRDDPAAAPGAVRAFLTTRAADAGFYVAVLALFAATGSLAFTDARPDGVSGVLVGAGLVIAAAGKSAQVPLQAWLSGAMAGPTPVSALLHSATMVAAGVYLLARSYELLAGWPLQVAGWIGALTAVAGAVVALGQADLKRLLAGSTASQLGLMFVGLAAGGPVVAILHLVTHAAGKAGLFLAAGMFQRARGTTALAGLRGVGREDRLALAGFTVNALSIAAVPPLAAFWSKEHITAATQGEAAWFVLVVLSAAGSAAYLMRAWRILAAPAGAGSGRVAGRGPMAAALVTTAAASVVLGALGGPLERVLGGDLPSSGLALVVSLAAVLAGAGLAYTPLPAALAGLARREPYTVVAQRVLLVRPVRGLARAVAVADRGIDAVVDGAGRAALLVARSQAWVERRGVDAAVDGLARAVGSGGRDLRRLQSGHLFEYFRDAVLGAAALALLVALTALL